MDTRAILAQLHAERARIEKAIAAIEALQAAEGAARRGRRGVAALTGHKKARNGRRRKMSAAARKRRPLQRAVGRPVRVERASLTRIVLLSEHACRKEP